MGDVNGALVWGRASVGGLDGVLTWVTQQPELRVGVSAWVRWLVY